MLDSSPGALLALREGQGPGCWGGGGSSRLPGGPMMVAAALARAFGGLSPGAILKGLLRGPRRPPGALLPFPPGLLVSFTRGSATTQQAALEFCTPLQGDSELSLLGDPVNTRDSTNCSYACALPGLGIGNTSNVCRSLAVAMIYIESKASLDTCDFPKPYGQQQEWMHCIPEGAGDITRFTGATEFWLLAPLRCAWAAGRPFPWRGPPACAARLEAVELALEACLGATLPSREAADSTEPMEPRCSPNCGEACTPHNILSTGNPTRCQNHADGPSVCWRKAPALAQYPEKLLTPQRKPWNPDAAPAVVKPPYSTAWS